MGPTTTDFEALFREEGPRLWRLVCAVTGGRRDIAEDAVAEAFVRAMERSERVQNPAAWITKTALRLAREEQRRQRRREMAEPAGVTVDIDGLQDLFRALRRLSPNQRAAVILHCEEDLPLKEAAWLMGTSAATARVHLYRGRKRLRQLLETKADPDG
jgi:RNA polymerase sigma-70 factor (ECF subfamily)